MEIHWRQGQFLRQHHFQAFQASLQEQGAWERSISNDSAWGVVRVVLDQEALASKRVVVRELCAVLPESGTVVNTALGAHVEPLGIGPALEKSEQALTIRLGVPRYDPRRVNAETPGHVPSGELLRYKVFKDKRFDDNLGDQAFEVEYRRIHARLFLEGADSSGMESVRLLQLSASAASGGAPEPGPKFVPPCLRITGSPILMRLLRELNAQLRVTTEEQLRSVSREPVSSPSGMMYLQCLGRYLASLEAMELGCARVSPLELYSRLDAMLWELMSFSPLDSRPPVQAYSHETPGPGLLALFKEVMDRLRPIGPPLNLITLEFQREDDVLVAAMEDEHFQRPVSYHLKIQSGRTLDELRKIVEDRVGFKVMPWSMRYFGDFGVPATFDASPPPQLRPQAGTTYFRLDRDAERAMWQHIRNERRISLFCGRDDLAKLDKVWLCMVVPEPAAGR